MKFVTSIIPHSLDVSDGFTKSQLFTEMSDVRLKTNISEIVDALQKVKLLKGYKYKWKKGDNSSTVIGFIAQQMSSVFPEVKIFSEFTFLLFKIYFRW